MQVTKPHVSKGDTVMVIAGKEKSKTGKILQLLPKKNGVIVEGLNLVKRHVKAKGNALLLKVLQTCKNQQEAFRKWRKTTCLCQVRHCTLV